MYILDVFAAHEVSLEFDWSVRPSNRFFYVLPLLSFRV